MLKSQKWDLAQTVWFLADPGPMKQEETVLFPNFNTNSTPLGSQNRKGEKYRVLILIDSIVDTAEAEENYNI